MRLLNLPVIFLLLSSLTPVKALTCLQLEKLSWKSLVQDLQFDSKAVACKPLPDDPTKAIVIVDRIPALVDVHSARILSQGEEISMLVNEPRFDIDTARYWIRTGIRAFAVTGFIHPYHQFFNHSVRKLTLFEIRNERIVPILENLAIEDDMDGMGEECADQIEDLTCEISEAHRTLTMLKSATHGYFDILVSEQSKQCGPADNIAKCKAERRWLKPTSRHYVFRFDGEHYVTADGAGMFSLQDY